MNTTRVWKRVLSLVMSVLLMLGMVPATELMTVDTYAATAVQVLYLKPNSYWTQSGARFAAYFFGNGEKWVSMTDHNGDGIYEVAVPSGYPSVIFCRMNPNATANNWNNKWNQTSDLTVPTDASVLYTVKANTWDKGGGSWSAPSSKYYVAGDAGLCGESWNSSADQMTANADGTYSITFAGVSAGTYELKVTDGTWDHSWGANGGSSNYALTLDVKADVTITFNPATKAITWSRGEEIPVVPDTYMVVGTKELCGTDWDTTDITNQLTDNGDGTYSITYYNVVTGSYGIKVIRNGDYAQGEWPSGYGNDHKIDVTKTSNVTVTFDLSTGEITHTLDPVTGPLNYDRYDPITLPGNEVFYVDVDIFDYLNDNRVIDKETGGYYIDNQGEKTSNGESPFSYFNQAISEQGAANGYAVPMYFGPLHFIDSRYGRIVNDSTKKSLYKWNAAANTALANTGGTAETPPSLNTSAVAQGLVYNQLVNGNLADPSNPALELPYFSKAAADTLKNNSYKVMDYYGGLQFPFKATYDPDTRVTKYSYDSASDYAVYYDYVNPQLYASNTHVLDTNDNPGFYPLNHPLDADNKVNNGFGMKFSVDFTVGDKGILADDIPVTFEFTGDDDVWVFIDGVLVLDMGGAHAKATGKIDFSTLTATVYNAANASKYDSSLVSGNTYESGSVDGKGLNNYIFHNEFLEERAALTAEDATVTFAYLGLKDFDYRAVHTMTVFYMERGMLESNFKMEFTMVPVPSGMSLSKELNEKDINAGILDEISAILDYTFTLVATSPSTTSVAFSQFTLTEKTSGVATIVNSDGTNSDKKYTDVINGVTNYTYAHNFRTASGQDAFIPGTHFEITEAIKGLFQYSDTRWAVYDSKNGYATVKSGSGTVADFSLGKTTDTVGQSYAVAFHNTMKLGNLSVTKIDSDELLADYDTRDYVFTIKLDLDGSGSQFASKKAYEGLVYIVDGEEYKTDKDGRFTLKQGQTATFKGIPAGATYEITEAKSDLYEVESYSNLTGTIVYNTTIAATITNKTVVKPIANKVIYVAKGVSTPYAPADLNAVIRKVDVTSGNLSVTGGDSSFTVIGNAVGKASYTYVATGVNGEYMTGSVTVYVYEATEESYVFDFGLVANLADISYGYGLFENGTYYIADADTSAKLMSIDWISGIGQTTITFSGTPTVYQDGTCSAAVTFKPMAFMSMVESYTYTVRITANDKTFDASNPETGTTVTGTINVMPANSVYYEDNFNATGSGSANKIVFSDNGPTEAPTMTQSNDQSGHYGYDDCYKGGYGLSGGSATTLTGTYAYKDASGKMVVVNGQYAYFTFTGTGFDLISNANSTAAGLAVYVFEADGYYKNDLDYVTTVDYKGTTNTLAETVFVNNYYNNGDLKQVPVVSVRLAERKTYTVYIQAVSTNYGKTVTIDGLRLYNNLSDTSDYKKVEQNVSVDELRALYLNEGKPGGKVSLAARVGNSVGVGLAKACTLLENMGGANYSQFLESTNGAPTVDDLKAVYFNGPNNEMYLPDEFGIKFSYQVTSSDWTLQLGAKALGSSKTVSVYARVSGGSYKKVGTITVQSTTDMYYDLTSMLSSYNTVNKTYDIIIISDSLDSQSNFVSLTTIKYSGINLP